MAHVQDVNITGSLELNETTAYTSEAGYVWWNGTALSYSVTGSNTRTL